MNVHQDIVLHDSAAFVAGTLQSSSAHAPECAYASQEVSYTKSVIPQLEGITCQGTLCVTNGAHG